MKRLTAYYGDCEEAYLSCERCGKTGIHECWTQEDCTQTAVDRLAAIEDILGDDYDLDRLKVIVNQVHDHAGGSISAVFVDCEDPD